MKTTEFDYPNNFCYKPNQCTVLIQHCMAPSKDYRGPVKAIIEYPTQLHAVDWS